MAPTNLDLFAVHARKQEAPPYIKGSDTSRQAAVRIRSKSANLRERVFYVIQRQGEYGVTDNEGIERSGIGGSTWRPRRVELVEQGRVRDSGRVRNKSVVWTSSTGGGGGHDGSP